MLRERRSWEKGKGGIHFLKIGGKKKKGSKSSSSSSKGKVKDKGGIDVKIGGSGKVKEPKIKEKLMLKER